MRINHEQLAADRLEQTDTTGAHGLLDKIAHQTAAGWSGQWLRCASLGLWFCQSLLVAGPSSQGFDRENLLGNSPFGKTQENLTPGPPIMQVELRGFVRDGDETWCCLVFVSPEGKAKSVWLRQGDELSGCELTMIDLEKMTAEIDIQGRAHLLEMKRAAIKLEASPATTATVADVSQADAVNAPGGASENQKRLQNVADEIRRRRAMRQSAVGPP